MIPVPPAVQRIPWKLIALLSGITGFGLLVLYSAAGGSLSPWAWQQGVRFIAFLIGALVLGRFPLRLFEDFPVWRLSLLGAVLSGVLMLVMLARPAARLGGAGYSLLVALVMLGSAWVFRWVVFMSVQGVPKYGAGLYLYSMPLGGDGLLGILGMFGLCLALLVAVVFVLERFPSFNPARAGH